MTTTDESPDEVYEEQEDHNLRRALGLRPIAYREDGAHPDSRPCPDWCWVSKSSYDHEVEWDHPLDATHTMGATPSIALSLHTGLPGHGSDRWVALSTLEPRLEQVGQGDPEIRVALRHYDGREMKYEHDLLRLALVDAQELVTVLSHLIDTAQR